MSGRSQEKIQRCIFCFKNRERQEVVSSHSIKDQEGRITCPFLRNFVCPYCGATGQNAHTQSYCPLRGPYKSLSKNLK